MVDFCITNRTFQALQDRIPVGRFGGTCVFFAETPWNRPIGITPFFAITQVGVDQIVLIFELDRHINTAVLCTKSHHNRISM
jgi:hypothetical protein